MNVSVSDNKVDNIISFVRGLNAKEKKTLSTQLKSEFELSFDVSQNKVDFIFSLLKTLNITDVAKLVSDMEGEFGFSIDKMLSGGGGGGGVAASAAEVVSDKPKKFAIIIKPGSAKKVEAIMKIRKLRSDLGLPDAKKLVEEGGELLSDLDEEKLKEAKAGLEGVSLEEKPC